MRHGTASCELLVLLQEDLLALIYKCIVHEVVLRCPSADLLGRKMKAFFLVLCVCVCAQLCGGCLWYSVL